MSNKPNTKLVDRPRRKICVLGSRLVCLALLHFVCVFISQFRNVGVFTYKYKYIFLFCLIKSTIIGKSSLVVQFVESVFVDSYYPTIETTFTKPIKYKGVEYECDILDTAGQVRSYCRFYMHILISEIGRILINQFKTCYWYSWLYACILACIEIFV